MRRETGVLRARARDLTAPLGYHDLRIIWVAQVLSEVGDWAARLALAVLVFERTGSAPLTALVTTVSLLPWVGVGQVLAAAGDRLPRRRVMVATDIGRAALFAAMIVPQPVWSLLALAFFAALMTPPFEAARSAMMPDTVPERVYPDAIALTSLTYQLALVVGYAAGGGLVALVGARSALAVNAVTFLASAIVLMRLRTGTEGRTETRGSELRRGVRVVLRDPFIRRAVLSFSTFAACATVAESLVAVYAVQELARGDGVVGLLAAMVPLGTIAGTALIPSRGKDARLLKLSAAIAAGGAVVAAVTFVPDPDLPWVVIPFFAVGVVFASSIPANTVAGLRLPDEVRASAFGLLQGIVMGAHGLGAALGGVLAAWFGVREACVAALAVAAVVALAALVRPAAEPSRTPDALIAS